jgi:hypothetical protein
MSGAILKFVVVDVDAHVPTDEVIAYAHAQQRQLLEHWGLYHEGLGLVRSATAHPVEDGDVEVQLIDKPTQDGALGYHDRKPDGTPIIYVFVGLAKQLGENWTSVASHEVLEVMGDPDLNLTVEMNDGFWDHEVCDRVEQDSYVVDGVELSNFNTPACFAPPAKLDDVKFDHLGLSKKPNDVRPGGYAQRFDPKKGWEQIGTASEYRQAMQELGLSRGARRRAAAADAHVRTPDEHVEAPAEPTTESPVAHDEHVE